jgi:hypothetical protein
LPAEIRDTVSSLCSILPPLIKQVSWTPNKQSARKFRCLHDPAGITRFSRPLIGFRYLNGLTTIWGRRDLRSGLERLINRAFASPKLTKLAAENASLVPAFISKPLQCLLIPKNQRAEGPWQWPGEGLHLRHGWSPGPIPELFNKRRCLQAPGPLAPKSGSWWLQLASSIP